MMDILAKAHTEVLARFAWSNVIIGLDFDGTLAPIVNHPADAQMRAPTRQLLADLAIRYPVAVISGRGRDDVQKRLGEIRLHAVIGNHGIEPGVDAKVYREVAAEWGPRLESALLHLNGVDVENKKYSVSVHYRRARRRRDALEQIRAAVAALGSGVRMVGGKQVVNIVPEGAPHKGLALLRLRKEIGADTALYVGDDVTDEDVFCLDEPGRLLGVRVGRSSSSHASYYVRDQASVDGLLERLCALRETAAQQRRASHTP